MTIITTATKTSLAKMTYPKTRPKPSNSSRDPKDIVIVIASSLTLSPSYIFAHFSRPHQQHQTLFFLDKKHNHRLQMSSEQEEMQINPTRAKQLAENLSHVLSQVKSANASSGGQNVLFTSPHALPSFLSLYLPLPSSLYTQLIPPQRSAS
jgi:hypothetical protein